MATATRLYSTTSISTDNRRADDALFSASNIVIRKTWEERNRGPVRDIMAEQQGQSVRKDLSKSLGLNGHWRWFHAEHYCLTTTKRLDLPIMSLQQLLKVRHLLLHQLIRHWTGRLQRLDIGQIRSTKAVLLISQWLLKIQQIVAYAGKPWL